MAGATPNSPTGTGQQGQATRSVLGEGTEVGKDRPGPLCKAPLSLPSHICARSRDCSSPEAANGTETQPLALSALEQAGGSGSPEHPVPLPPSALGPAAQHTEGTLSVTVPVPTDTPSTCSSCCDMSWSQAGSAPSPWHPKPPILFAWMHLGDPGRILQLHSHSAESIPASCEDAKDSQTTYKSFAGFRVCCLSFIKVPHFQNLVYRVTEALPDISLDMGNQVKSAVQ